MNSILEMKRKKYFRDFSEALTSSKRKYKINISKYNIDFLNILNKNLNGNGKNLNLNSLEIGKKLLFLVVVLVSAVVLGLTAFKVIPKETMPDFLERGYTWVARIDRFADKETYEEKYSITDDNLQEQHGKIAIARGGFFGLMPGNSVQRDFLPQAYSDFIYAIIVEELGMFGGIFLIVMFMILLYRAGRIATMSRTVFPAILVMGLTLMIVIQAFVSMAVSTGLGPVTGQPMPLISRGGTSILITSIYFGIIFGVTRQIKEERLQTASDSPVPAIPVIEEEEEEEVEEL